MKRRNFLRSLGIGVLAAPVAIEAIKGVDVPPQKSMEKLLEQHPFDKYNFEPMGFIFPDPKTINLIAPVKPSKIGQAIYIYTDEDKAGMHNIIHIPSVYFDEEGMPQIYIVVGENRRITELYPEMHFKYTCYPLSNNLALTKEIPVTQKLIIGGKCI